MKKDTEESEVLEEEQQPLRMPIPTFPSFGGSLVSDMLVHLDTAMLLKSCQILIEYSNSGAVVTAVDAQNNRIREYFSAKMDVKGLKNVDTLMELTRFLSNLTGWKDVDEKYKLTVGLTPRTSESVKEFYENINDIVEEELIAKIQERGYIVAKAFKD